MRRPAVRRRTHGTLQSAHKPPSLCIHTLFIMVLCSIFWISVFYWMHIQFTHFYDSRVTYIPHKNEQGIHVNPFIPAHESEITSPDIAWQRNLQHVEFRDVSQFDRIVVIGDLHGDLPQAINALVLTGIIDENTHQWIAKNTILIQTGDIVDRGTQSIEIYDMFLDLREECLLHGSLVLNQVGNHEHLQFINDWSYVNQEEMQRHGGYDEWKKLMSSKAKIGSFLRSLPIARIVGKSLFVHAGILPNVAAAFHHNLTELNQRFHHFVMETSMNMEINPMIYYQSLSEEENKLTGLDGPIWTRYFEPMYYDFNMEQIAYSHLKNELNVPGNKPRIDALTMFMCSILEETLNGLKVERMIIGHNVQMLGAVKVSCEGKLYAIDVGMAGHYGGNMAALEIDPKTDTVRIITDPNNPAHALMPMMPKGFMNNVGG